ncbi:hypothetical protein ACHAQJ_003771 [Trichoderma viride]
MRFEDWDILLFPRDCKVPVKEFKVACHAIHDAGASKNGDLEPLRFPSFRQELLRQNHWSPADNFGRIKVVISEGFPRDSPSVPIERVKNVVAFSFQHAPLEILEASCIAWPNPSMWRRLPVTTSMAVQAYPSDDTESHAHSPRRKHSRTSANMPTSSTENVHRIITNRSLRNEQRKFNTQSGSSRSTSGSTSTGTMETINDSDAYFEWLNGMGLGMTDMYRFDEQETFPAMAQNGRRSAKIDMQDHISVGHGMAPYLSQRFSLQTFRDEDESDHFGCLKMPTEPLNIETSYGQDTQGMDGKKRDMIPLSNDSDYGRTGLFLPRIPQDNLFSIDLTNTLAHSLLNQPMPAHMLANSLHTTPIPELRLPNEDYFHQTAGPSPSTASSASTSLKDHCEVGKAAQKPYTVRNTNSQTGSYGSRVYRSTRPDVKQHISSVLSALESGSIEEQAMGNTAAHSIEKGTKRNRDSASTPVSVAKSDDNQKRPSPRARLTALLAHSPVVDC